MPKGNMGYDQYTVPDTIAVEPTFSIANIRPWRLVHWFFQISLKEHWTQNHPQYLSGLIVKWTFFDKVSRNSCIANTTDTTLLKKLQD